MERAVSWKEKLNIIEMVVFPTSIFVLGVTPVLSDKGAEVEEEGNPHCTQPSFQKTLLCGSIEGGNWRGPRESEIPYCFKDKRI